ncbi:MAG: adenylate/guanylate cyclase domain-containing protein [Bacteroidales bacterium]|nr:adenylate/guanylate cyclase domain-containing protein [Bacteroidales bacterium]
MRNEKLKFFFSEDYRFQQSTILILAIFGFLGHFMFYSVLNFFAGFWESWPLRVLASLLFLSLLLLPRKTPLKKPGIWYYELVYVLVFPVMFLLFLIKNEVNSYWAASVVFSAVLYRFLTHPPKALFLYPLSIILTLFAYSMLYGWPEKTADIILIEFPAYFIMILIGILQTMIRMANAKAENEYSRSESLLRNILPDPVIARLKAGQQTIVEKFSEASILFVDIVGFTPVAEKEKPEDILNLLNNIFTRFDNLTDTHGAEKIKTIGDAYMVVSGAPVICETHAERIALLALDMIAEIEDYNLKHKAPIAVRIGIHSGPVVAGVIGTKKFAYDIWGDTVNTASRMESNGLPGKIHISGATAALLTGKFRMTCRGEIEIKGKGLMTTYFLETRI